MWDGTLDAGALKLRFLLTVSESAGDVAMTMETGAQDVRELDVTLTIQGDQVRLNVPALGAVYVGTLDASGQTISGTWRQAGRSPPAHLREDGLKGFAMVGTNDLEIRGNLRDAYSDVYTPAALGRQVGAG